MAFRPPVFLRRSLLAVTAAVLMIIGFGFAAVGADTAPPEHDWVVSETPRSGWPTVLGNPTYINVNDTFGLNSELDREVRAAAEVGPYLVIGGNFHFIETTGGAVVEKRYLAAFHRTTGQLVSMPVVDNEVMAIEADPDGQHVFVTGRFNTVGGQTHRKIVRIHVASGDVDDSFVANANSAVKAIEISGTGRLFVGGTFTAINGAAVDNLAELDPNTGSIRPQFRFAIEGIDARGTFEAFSSGEVKSVDVTPDGRRLVMVHRAATVNGQPRSGYAVFDISNPQAPTLTSDHSNSFFAWPNCVSGALPTSGAMSPDGSFLVMGTSGFDEPPCQDSVIAFPIGGGPNAPARWSHAMRDTVTSVAVSEAAVYAGGHFCRIDVGPRATVGEGRDNIFCTGGVAARYPTGAWRWQLAALAPSDGTPFAWDPGMNAFRGSRFMRVTNQGLYIGFDGDEVNDTRVGSLTLLPLGPAPTIPPIPRVFCNGVLATIVGTEGRDVLTGTGGRDVIAGLGGDDTILALGGDDLVCGGDGNDILDSGRGNDTMFGNDGRDLLLGSAGNDVLDGGRQNDRVRGGTGSDVLRGGSGRDRISGNGGPDLLYGSAGNDVLVGGGGEDEFNGGGAIDRCLRTGLERIKRCELFV
ncbi:MAG: hypothetical protein HKN94_00340 [Acidimicrobiales bacterium]|nr:hypothetical protein [Acidimicrobiales bacterium]